jgi:DNA-binding IscR family transcriptional regulator
LCGLFERAQDGLKDALTRTTLADLIEQQEKIELTQPKGRLN